MNNKIVQESSKSILPSSLKLHHVGIATNNLEHSIQLYKTFFNASLHLASTEMIEHGVVVAFLQSGNLLIELITPLKSSQHAKALEKFLNSRGPGLHHLAFTTDNIEQSTGDLIEQGAQVLGDTATRGALGMPVRFFHPKSFDGTLIELIEIDKEVGSHNEERP